MIEAAQFQRWREEISFCRSLEALELWVQRIVEPTGFGSNSMADIGEPLGLDYVEIAECLEESDRSFFEQEITLLRLAQQQRQLLQDGGTVPEKPAPINPWEFFM